MTDNILSVPVPTREKGQRSLSVEDAYFTRIIPSWTFPSGLTPAHWRYWVNNQPVAIDFRDTLIATVQSLDWKITPRESEMRDELKMSVRYHTRLLEHGGYWMDLDWTALLEWIGADLMDLPFGAAVEIGRKNDEPEGRVVWFKPLDGGTLYPTLNKNFPVMQYYASAVQVVNFPEHAINRMYLSPRREIEREGWGMAPPEKVYMAMEMLARGDKYYANLLLDVPPAGLLDLMDMEKDTALDWVSSFRTFIAGGGVDGFKIPVLYEHTGKVEFIPFGKVPNDIMYDRITLKYAALVGAAYGMSLNDIGLQSTSSSGETLAGTIRAERRTRKTGLARLKKKLKFFFEKMLPDTLQFDWIDMDDELATALGRARLANATAMNQLITSGVIDRKEGRLQLIQDGLMTISMAEEPPTKPDPNFAPGNQERPGMLGSPQAPSQGGDGEVKKSLFKPTNLNQAIDKVVSVFSLGIIESLSGAEYDEYQPIKSAVLDSVFSDNEEGLGAAVGLMMKSEPIGEFDYEALRESLLSAGVNVDNMDLEQKCEQEFPLFLGRAIVHALVSSDNLLSDDLSVVKEKINKNLPEYVEAYIATLLGEFNG